jgi:N-acetylglucosaminyldiphosphoundecaprenol N-acetyl-beta-D-mannosaminyltransferase
MNTITTLGFTVLSDELDVIPINSTKCRVINTISPNSYGIATKDAEFEHALKTSDYLVLDGVYFAFSSLLLQGKNIKRNQGPDVFYHFIGRLNKQGGKAFFLGSSESTLQKIKARAKDEYPGITVETFSPPFKPEFSDEENAEMVAKINAFQPDILFVGMTCPKQEKWAIAHRDKLKAGLAICIGNVFDWYAGTQKAIHPIWFKLRIGWLVRIFLRPEVFKRNIGNQMLFFWHVILIFLKIRKYDSRSNYWIR